MGDVGERFLSEQILLLSYGIYFYYKNNKLNVNWEDFKNSLFKELNNIQAKELEKYILRDASLSALKSYLFRKYKRENVVKKKKDKIDIQEEPDQKISETIIRSVSKSEILESKVVIPRPNKGISKAINTLNQEELNVESDSLEISDKLQMMCFNHIVYNNGRVPFYKRLKKRKFTFYWSTFLQSFLSSDKNNLSKQEKIGIQERLLNGFVTRVEKTELNGEKITTLKLPSFFESNSDEKRGFLIIYGISFSEDLNQDFFLGKKIFKSKTRVTIEFTGNQFSGSFTYLPVSIDFNISDVLENILLEIKAFTDSEGRKFRKGVKLFIQFLTVQRYKKRGSKKITSFSVSIVLFIYFFNINIRAGTMRKNQLFFYLLATGLFFEKNKLGTISYLDTSYSKNLVEKIKKKEINLDNVLTYIIIKEEHNVEVKLNLNEWDSKSFCLIKETKNTNRNCKDSVEFDSVPLTPVREEEKNCLDLKPQYQESIKSELLNPIGLVLPLIDNTEIPVMFVEKKGLNVNSLFMKSFTVVWNFATGEGAILSDDGYFLVNKMPSQQKNKEIIDTVTVPTNYLLEENSFSDQEYIGKEKFYIEKIKEKYKFLVQFINSKKNLVNLNKRQIKMNFPELEKRVIQHKNFYNEVDWPQFLFFKGKNERAADLYKSFRIEILDNVNEIFTELFMLNSSPEFSELDNEFFERKKQIFLGLEKNNLRITKWLNSTNFKGLFSKGFQYSAMVSKLKKNEKSNTSKTDRIYEKFFIDFNQEKLSSIQFFERKFKEAYISNIASSAFNMFILDIDMVACHAFIALNIRPHIGLPPTKFKGKINWELVSNEISQEFYKSLGSKNLPIEFENFLESNKFTTKYIKRYILALLNGRNPSTPLYCFKKENEIKEFIRKKKDSKDPLVVEFFSILNKTREDESEDSTSLATDLTDLIDIMDIDNRLIGSFVETQNRKWKVREKVNPYISVFSTLRRKIINHPLSKEIIESFKALTEVEFFAGDEVINLIIPFEEISQFKGIVKLNKKLKTEKNRSLPSSILFAIESYLLYGAIIDICLQKRYLASISFDGFSLYVKDIEEISQITFPTYEKLCQSLFDNILDLKFVLFYNEGELEKDLVEYINKD